MIEATTGTARSEPIKPAMLNPTISEIMMITGYATVESAVEAMKTGAVEYLAKPFTKEELFTSVERALEKLVLHRNGDSVQREPGRNFPGIIGESSAIKQLLKSVEQVASSGATVLISGESGTGKELVARAIHYTSPRAAAPFVTVNCGAIPESLLESELFGYVKGAFTGADQSRAGFFQTADQGTIFLDEIAETTPRMQVKLLRALQEKEVYMVGSSKPFRLNVRIVAATNKDLQILMEKGAFREDLYYRLNVISLVIPPLRDREHDIIIMAKHFAAKFSEEMSKPPPVFSDKVMELFTGYAWPGNVRELENLIQRIVIMNTEKVIDVPDLPEFMHFSLRRRADVFRSLAEVEKDHIRVVLTAVGDNKTRAAEILGIRLISEVSVPTTRRKVRKVRRMVEVPDGVRL